jgi:TRAP-type mannitol/chloroaromatic compound transport system permease small subunit
MTGGGPGADLTAASLPERLVAAVGRGVAWFTLAMVLITVFVVVARYGFRSGWVWLQESVGYLHAAVFMLAAAWTLQRDGHVRVDIFYREAGPRRRAWVDLTGTVLFLIPFCVFLAAISWDYVIASWRLLESSNEAGGLPLVYLLKSLLIAMPVLLLVQALAGTRRDWATLRSGAAGGSQAGS